MEYLTAISCYAMRRELGLSREELALLAGVAVVTVWRFERGCVVPMAVTMERIEKALDDIFYA